MTLYIKKRDNTKKEKLSLNDLKFKCRYEKINLKLIYGNFKIFKEEKIWDLISMNDKVNTKILDRFHKYINWKLLIKNIDIINKKEYWKLLLKYHYFIDWKWINNNLDTTIKFKLHFLKFLKINDIMNIVKEIKNIKKTKYYYLLHQYKYTIDWLWIIKNRELTSDFIEEFIDVLDINTVIKYQSKYISYYTLEYFKDRYF